jgi:hypothetical protein
MEYFNEERRKTVNYTKPEVTVLGQAVQVINHVGKELPPATDGTAKSIMPAYDLDE